MINLRKARKKLRKSKWGRKLCDAYAELAQDYEEARIRAMNAEAKLMQVQRVFDDGDEGM